MNTSFVNTNLVWTKAYNTDLKSFGFNKPFALDRGQRVLEKLSVDFGRELDYIQPQPITLEDAALVHTKEYLQSLGNDQTWWDIFELRYKDLLDKTKPDLKLQNYKPLHHLIDDILLKSGGTLTAARLALKYGLAANLGGGYHHAFANQGRGYCVLHDIAITIRKLKNENLIDKVMIIDLDFHQGDGTALIFENDPSVFTLSVHSKEGWPEEKQRSSLDIEIDQYETNLYLDKTKQAINQALSGFKPDLICFVAGSDPYEKDVLPGSKLIQLSLETMIERDKFVLDTCTKHKIPMFSVFAGGYGPDVWEVHYHCTKHMLELHNKVTV